MTHADKMEDVVYSSVSGGLYHRDTGARLGVPTSRGYRLVSVGGKQYAEARLIWFLVTGAWPTCVIDHKNRDKSYNAWINLRNVTHSENSRNRESAKEKSARLLSEAIKKVSR